MGPFLGGVVLPMSIVIVLRLLRPGLRRLFEDVHIDQARALFRREREWLEARFLTALAKLEPHEAARWDDARWLDEVVWARDRKSRRLLALVGVRLPAAGPFDDDAAPRHATALFEFHKGRWHADGKRLDRTLPAQAFAGNNRIEPVAVANRRA